MSHDDMVFDSVDRAIISWLQRDGRTPYQAIAAQLGVTVAEVGERAEAMSAAGVFDIIAVTNPLALGYARQAMLTLEVQGSLDPAIDALAAMDEVIYLVRFKEPRQILAEVVGRSDARMLELVAEFRRLPGVVRIHTALVRNVVKESYDFGIADDAVIDPTSGAALEQSA